MFSGRLLVTQPLSPALLSYFLLRVFFFRGEGLCGTRSAGNFFPPQPFLALRRAVAFRFRTGAFLTFPAISVQTCWSKPPESVLGDLIEILIVPPWGERLLRDFSYSRLDASYRPDALSPRFFFRFTRVEKLTLSIYSTSPVSAS